MHDLQHRTCNVCGILKPLEQYPKQPYGHKRSCRPCWQETYRRAWDTRRRLEEKAETLATDMYKPDESAPNSLLAADYFE